MTRTRQYRSVLLAVIVLAAVASAVADVVLNPGYIAGTYQVTGVTLSQASFQAQAGSQTSNVNGSGGSYQLTVNVPSGGSQQFTLTSWFYSDSGRDYLQPPSRTVTVGDGAPATENFAIIPGYIQGTLTVNGGTTTSAYISTNAAQAPSSYAQTSLVAPYTTFLFPVYPGLHNVSGSATVSGVSYSLTSQQVTVAAGQTATVHFVVNATANTGSIVGNLAYSGLSPQRVDVSASGPASPTVQLTQPGPYSLTGLPNGSYSLYAYARFNGLQDYLYLPNSSFPSSSRSVTISAGGSVTRDISFAARAVAGSIVVSGPRTLSSVNYAQVYTTGLSPSAAAGGQSFARVVLPSGTFVLPASDGSWRPTVYLQFLDTNQQTYLNSTMEVFDSRPSNTIAVSGNMTMAPIAYDVGTVTVVMAVPPPLTFSSPNLSGYCTERDANNAILRQYYVNASRAVSNVNTASVTFVGLKGACDLQARVSVSGGSVSIGQVVTAVVPGVEQNVDIGGPTLAVTSPSANFVTTGTSVTVTGTATDDAQVQSVTVNNVAQTLTSTNNPADPRQVTFSTTVNLPTLGAHTITTRATDIAGKITTDTRTVFRKAQPIITWNAPAALPFGTPLSATQLNAVARVDASTIPGQMVYSPPSGTVLAVGDDQGLSVTFTPTDQTRYLTAQASVTIDVFASQPTITWAAPANIQYGTALGAAQLNATATLAGSAVAGVFTYSPAAGAALGVGTHQLSVTFTPSDSSYQSASASVSLTVTRAPLTVTANPASRSYGADNPAFSAAYAGFVAGDDPTDLGGALTFSTPAVPASSVGSYAVTPSGLVSNNYAISFVAGTLSVTPAALTVTASSNTRPYGAANPAFTASFSGFVLNQTPAVLGGTLAFDTAADATSSVGTYPVTPSGLTSTNYAISFVDGTLVVTTGTLQVTAANLERAYGAANPPLVGTVSGLAPSDGIVVSYETTAMQASAVGGYPIEPVLSDPNGRLGNYQVSLTPGTLTVTQAQLQVTAADATRAFGDDNPAFTGTASGLVAADGISVSYATTATAASPAGQYPIEPALSDPLGRLANYQVSLTPGSLQITRRALTVTAADVSRNYGATTPAFSASYSGFAAGDSAASLGGTLGFGGPAATATAVGSYEIVPSGLSSANYQISFVSGTLTIAQATLTVSAQNQTRVYGAAPGPFAVSYSGFVNGDDPGDLSGTLTFGGPAQGAVNVGTYAITPGGLTSANYVVSFVGGTLTVTPRALTIRADNKNIVLGEALPAFTATYDGFVNGDTPASLDTPTVFGTSATGQAVGSFGIQPSGASDANYTIAFLPGSLTVTYALGACLGEAGHTILQPVNADGTSVFKQKSTVPLKFRVCDAAGTSIANGVVSSFLLLQKTSGTATVDVNEAPISTTPDTTFRWDPSAQQWVFNLNTKNLQAGQTYRYQIGLADGTVIPFQFGLR
jgi:hypothetical protein